MIINFRGEKVCQLKAYQDCYDKHNKEFDWIAFFDIDEFLTLTSNFSISDYLSLPIFKDVGKIHINWMMYGDNELYGYENNNDRKCLTRFTKPLPFNIKGYDFFYKGYENNHIKPIVRGGLENVEWVNTPHTPKTKDILVCNNSGKECKPNSPFCDYDFSIAYLKHFATKTIIEYTKKISRGYCDQTDKESKRNLNFYRFFKLNKITEGKVKYIDTTIPWDIFFDKIYCIHMAEMEDRKERLLKELKRVDINVNANYFAFKITTNNPMYEYIYSNPNFKQNTAPYITKGIKNCSMAHYEILKEAQVMGYKRILILEDDIAFLKNKFLMYCILFNLPDSDIILLDKWTFNKDMYMDLITNKRVNGYFACYSNNFSSCACYSLNQKGIKSILEIQDNNFQPQDFCVNSNLNPNTTKSFSIINLGIQKQYKTSEKDIEYNKKAYEGIIKMNYYNIE